mmetsp:Transcript_7776/g.17549  ORF Transcript_7776/g.17549 Transcript_7776/m.17549 type:complete len:663 (+) Transcript_7776:122-2110(+)
MSLLSITLTRHGRRRLRPPPLALHQPSPLIAGLDDNNNDDENNGTHNMMWLHHHHQQQQCGGKCHLSTNMQQQGSHYQPTTDTNYTVLLSTSSSPLSAMATRRQYHTTTRKEILPLIAVGVLGASAVYTYKAFQQMDQDWEEYYMDLEEYKSKTGIDPEKEEHNATAAADNSNATNENDLSSFFTGGTLAIDMGTSGLKLSHRSSTANKSLYKNGKPPAPMVSVDREGFRSTPSLVWVPPTSEGEEMLIGRLAEARSYDTRGGKVVHPREALENSDTQNGDDQAAIIQQTIRAAASNALDQVMGGSSGASSSLQSKNPLFVLDASMSTRGSYNVRPIVTYPPQQQNDSTNPTKYLERYQQAMNGLTSPAGIAEFITEPIAIVSGAEYYNLLPPKNASTGSSVLVVDVGGTTTCVSMVGGDDDEEEVLYSATLPFGGDTFIDLLVSHLVEGFYGHNKDNEADKKITSSSPSSKPKLNDPTALQRLYEASTTAMHELSNKTRSEINIPYLTMDLKTRQPKHLEVGMARNVIEAELETWVQKELVPYLQKTTTTDNNHQTSNSALSQALPPPTNLSTLFSSAIMSSLEQTAHTPNTLRAILLVGGGARIPLVREAMKEGVGYLAGDAYANGGGGEGKRLIMPEGEMGDELGVLGAAVWGSGGGGR